MGILCGFATCYESPGRYQVGFLTMLSASLLSKIFKLQNVRLFTEFQGFYNFYNNGGFTALPPPKFKTVAIWKVMELVVFVPQNT